MSNFRNYDDYKKLFDDVVSMSVRLEEGIDEADEHKIYSYIMAINECLSDVPLRYAKNYFKGIGKEFDYDEFYNEEKEW